MMVLNKSIQITNKKELKKQYKASPPKMGIFQIKNLTNGKIFIKKPAGLF
jgi:hypothetical protein